MIDRVVAARDRRQTEARCLDLAADRAGAKSEEDPVDRRLRCGENATCTHVPCWGVSDASGVWSRVNAFDDQVWAVNAD